jgi:hypothetical protein
MLARYAYGTALFALAAGLEHTGHPLWFPSVRCGRCVRTRFTSEGGIAQMKKALVFLAILWPTFLTAEAVLIPAKKIENSLGISDVYTNTNAYILALPLDGQVLGGEVTNIRLQPYGTPQLYDENLLLCGDVTGAFNDKSGVLVIVYDKVSHRLYQNVPCHDLKGVFETK